MNQKNEEVEKRVPVVGEGGEDGAVRSNEQPNTLNIGHKQR